LGPEHISEFLDRSGRYRLGNAVLGDRPPLDLLLVADRPVSVPIGC
jgi:hypothetical protein